MHRNEVSVDTETVRWLLAGQFPQLADLPIERVRSAGTDNALYRLGDELVVRLPRIPSAALRLEKETTWLPRVAPHLPLDVPAPLATGVAAEHYPWRWGVYRWLEGEDATAAPIADSGRAAVSIAGFVRALHAIDPSEAPSPGEHNFFRGAPLASRDAATRAAIGALGDVYDEGELRSAWDAALRTQPWDLPGVWIHGDLLPANLLVVHGEISAVIDFGGLGAGDPACDLTPAWALFSGESRDAFRSAVDVDDATWERARGWALSIGLVALPYYRDTNPPFAAVARRMIDRVLAEV